MIKFTTAKDFQFHDYIYPVLKVFQDYTDGKILTNKEIKDRVIKLLEIPEEELSIMMDKEKSFFCDYRIGWAISYAKLGGYIENISRGNYAITSKGLEVKSKNDLNNFWLERSKKSKNTTEEECISIQGNSEENYEDKNKEEFLEIIRNLEPTQFELFCKELLKKMGMQSVIHTGKPNDKGVDIYGEILVDNFITYRIAFQCKRYARYNTISSADIYQFMGSPTVMDYDKCAFITTSYYKRGVVEEMKNYGSKLTLIDADGLWELIKKYEYGVQKKQVTIVEIDNKTIDLYK